MTMVIGMKRIFSYLGIVALIIWGFGVYNTIQFLEQSGIPNEGYVSLFIGVLLQIVMSFSQHIVWTKQSDKRKIVIGCVVLIVDTLTNFGNIFPTMLLVKHTDTYVLLGLPDNPNKYILMVIALGISAIVAVLPEVLISE